MMVHVHKARLGQSPQMFRDRRLADFHRFDDLAHRQRTPLTREEVQDLDARRIRQASEPARIELSFFPFQLHR